MVARLRPALRGACVVLGLGLPFVFSAPALADSADSANWSGYAIHRAGLRFNRVVGSWRLPQLSCVPGSRTYSATWIGLGGFTPGAPALEQIGTESDCTARGRPMANAWFELIPAPSRIVRLPVAPGDVMRAQVSASGRRVTLWLDDLTRGRRFHRAITVRALDQSSAEWIVEAPSDCFDDGSCEVLPLANFGATAFSVAAARTVDGHSGTIADPAWDLTRLRLVPDPSGTQPASYAGLRSGFGSADTSALTDGGSGFTVSFSAQAASRAAMRRARAAFARPAVRVRHPRYSPGG